MLQLTPQSRIFLATTYRQLNNHKLKLVGSSYGLKVRIRVKDPS